MIDVMSRAARIARGGACSVETPPLEPRCYGAGFAESSAQSALQAFGSGTLRSFGERAFLARSAERRRWILVGGPGSMTRGG